MNYRLPVIVSVVSLLVLGCSREAPVSIADAPESAPTESVVTVSVTPPEPLKGTGSIYFTEDEMSVIRNVVIYGVDEETGLWRRAYLVPSGTDVTTMMTFVTGRPVTFYVLANMGNVEIPNGTGGRLDVEGFSYLIPSRASLETSGIPMAGKAEVGAASFTGDMNVSIGLERLMAKLVVSVDKTDLTGGVVAPVFLSDYVSIRQANRRLRPFAAGGSRAESSGDIFASDYGIFDLQDFPTGEGAMTHGGIVLYVPENRQGVLTANHDQTMKVPGELPSGMAGLCTYIEYFGSKDGSGDGIAGDICYRGYLGADTEDDFSVMRNTSYAVSLSLTWDGFMWNADGWRIDADVTDSRRLVLSGAPESLTPVTGNTLGNVKRGALSGVYVNFSRDGGTTWVHDAKDIDDWPYGWEFYVDGVKQVGGSGASSGKIAWNHQVASGFMIVSPAMDAEIGSEHTLQVRSVDGKVVSNTVTFTVTAPLGLQWQTGVPQYVAQRGRLVVSELSDPSAEVVYTVTSGDDIVRLTSSGDSQTKMVSLIASGTAMIHAECAATGQSDDISVTAMAPSLLLSSSQYYANPDGAEARSGSTGLVGTYASASYTGTSGALTRVSASPTASVLGNSLDAALYDELLAFTPSVESSLLATSCAAGYGVITLHTAALSAGGDSYPAAGGSSLGSFTVGAKVAATGVVPVSAPVLSVDPFSLYPSGVSVDTGGDVEDFSIIGYGTGLTWGGYTNTGRSTSFPTTRATTTYVGVEAFVNDAASADAVLSAALSGTPGGTVSWNSIVTTRSDVHTAGPFSLKAYVRNRYSDERMYSGAFYKGRLFRHGAVVAFETEEPTDAGGHYTTAGSVRVSVRYYMQNSSATYFERAAAYPSVGLGCAFPDVGTHRSNEVMSISWSNYESHMEHIPGSLNISINMVDYPRAVKSSETGYLYTVLDVCWEHHDGLLTSVCHEEWSGSPQMFFCVEDFISILKYKDGYIRRISEDLVHLHPAGAPLTSVDGKDCGYFVLHIRQQVESMWL